MVAVLVNALLGRPCRGPACAATSTARIDVASRARVASHQNLRHTSTEQILRNTIGERVLGLPPEPRLDKGVPFSELREREAVAG